MEGVNAVIRLKRRLEDEPLDALVLNCKRRKTEEISQDGHAELSTLLQFAGTVENQEDDIFTHLKKPSKSELEEQFKKHNVNLHTKLRNQKQEDSKTSRYKIVNCFRSQSTNLDSSIDHSNESELTVYDIETENNEDCSENKENKSQYVYDLYCTTSDDLGDANLEDYVSMYPYNDQFMYGSLRDNGLNQPDSENDSEDSNAESNWKNDYPDESDMESITEEDMMQAMKKCDLSDLSSDDGEEGFVYSVDSEAAGFEEDIDQSDVQRYGERYARFKARHKKEKDIPTSTLHKDFYYGDIDEEEYYY